MVASSTISELLHQVAAHAELATPPLGSSSISDTDYEEAACVQAGPPVIGRPTIAGTLRDAAVHAAPFLHP